MGREQIGSLPVLYSTNFQGTKVYNREFKGKLPLIGCLYTR